MIQNVLLDPFDFNPERMVVNGIILMAPIAGRRSAGPGRWLRDSSRRIRQRNGDSREP